MDDFSLQDINERLCQLRIEIDALNKRIDSLIKSYECFKKLEFPIMYHDARPISLACYIPTSQVLLLTYRQLNSAINCRYEKCRWNTLDDNLFYRIIETIFELKDYIKEFCAGKREFYFVESVAEELVEALCESVGYNKRVGKFFLTEFAEKVYNKIMELECEHDIKRETKTVILNDLDHLIFRLATYSGKNYRELFVLFSYLNDNDYIEKNKNSNINTLVDIEELFWDRVNLLGDDYEEYEDLF